MIKFRCKYCNTIANKTGYTSTDLDTCVDCTKALNKIWGMNIYREYCEANAKRSRINPVKWLSRKMGGSTYNAYLIIDANFLGFGKFLA